MQQFHGSDEYIASDELIRSVNIAAALKKPLLIKGEPGTGKTMLAEAIARSLDMELLIWNIKSTTRAQDGLYVYDTVQRLYDSQFGADGVDDIARYIRLGKMGEAFEKEKQTVLLIDEIDKADLEFPNDLLWELDKMEFYIPETGKTVKAKHRPIVIITSNAEKELPDAFLRRCIFHYIAFPEQPMMEKIIKAHYPDLDQKLIDGVLDAFYRVRDLRGLQKKPSTSEVLDWIQALVIGGVPGNFEVSARLGDSPFFVIEADEYDCAFFDKRSKFVHYCPRTLILNNLEFDHADIFDDLKAIQKQFHHLVRIVPGKGKIILPENDINLKQVMAMGCWSEQELVGEQGHWQAKKLNADASEWEVLLDGEKVGEVKWALVGEHNMHNGLMAIAAARHVGVLPADAANALGSFINARRRLELRGEANGVTVYDDFAHHPTAILATLQALRGKVGGTARILAVLEPRSNTMKMGVCKDDLAPSLGRADEVFLLQPQHIPWQVAEVAEACVQPAHWSADVDTLAEMVVKTAHPGDHILVMSNGGFGGIHQKLLDKLAQKAAAAE